MKTLIFIILSIVISFSSIKSQNQSYYNFKSLPYETDELEPYFDQTTMKLHYEKHHYGYYTKFTNAMKENNFENKPIQEIFATISEYPLSIRNFGGGYWNHQFYWESLSPDTSLVPGDNLLKAVKRDFGNMQNLENEFKSKAKTLFGAGWAWLILTNDNKLKIVTTTNQDNPLMDIATEKGTPLLCIDVWEHAYYLKYKNKRGDFIKNFWKIINWDKVTQRYNNAIE